MRAPISPAAWRAPARSCSTPRGRSTRACRPAQTDIAMAASYAGDACLAVARRAHQIFGAISYCDEHPLHRFHKRIVAGRLAYGEPASHHETIARAIGLA